MKSKLKVLSKNELLKIKLFNFYKETTLINNIILAIVMAFITGVSAQIVIPLPFTPVPITGQVLGVFMSGLICGPYFGVLSQILYFGAGVAGVPWFAGFGSGLTVTIGYFVGFIISAYILGKASQLSFFKKFFNQFLVMAFCQLLIYISGALGLMFMLNLNLVSALEKGVYPFIFVGILKLLLIAKFTSIILPSSEK